MSLGASALKVEIMAGWRTSPDINEPRLLPRGNYAVAPSWPTSRWPRTLLLVPRNADHNLATSDHQTAGKSAGLEAYIVTDLSSFRGSTRWENLHPSDISSIFLWDPWGVLVRTIWPSKNSYGSVAQLDEFPRDDLAHDFCGTSGKARAHNKRLMQNWKRGSNCVHTQQFQRHNEGGTSAECWCRKWQGPQ